uniref:THD domain-containing protein n=1 Tax=Lates calcarifer TaxID=8187 RepID=A0A4W6DDL7_LATCA
LIYFFLPNEGEEGKPSSAQSSKAFAHLRGGSAVVHENEFVHWNIDDDTLLHDIDHRGGRLVIQKEGYYHVYSKISYINTTMFYHSVMLTGPRYKEDITLIKSWKNSVQSLDQSNSCLDGVFHLTKGCTIFVKVSDTSKIFKNPTQNYFGAFII